MKGYGISAFRVDHQLEFGRRLDRQIGFTGR